MVHTAVHSDFVGDLLPMTCDVVRALASAWKYLSIAHYHSRSRIQRSTELCFGLSRELAVPPSKLVLLFNAAFCRRDKSLSHSRKKGWLVGAVGIELKATLKARKLLIPLNAKNAKNTQFAQLGYTTGTRAYQDPSKDRSAFLV